jgi:hypothetical protein
VAYARADTYREALVVRSLYRWWSALVFLMVIVQIGFAGYGAFAISRDVGDGKSVDEDRFEDLFGLHMGFGYIVILAGLVFLAIGLAAGIGKWRLGRQGLLALLLVIQLFLAWIGGSTPELGFLHPLNAVVIFILAGWIAWSEWKSSRLVGRGAAAT